MLKMDNIQRMKMFIDCKTSKYSDVKMKHIIDLL